MKISDLHSPYMYGFYKGCIAIENSHRNTIYVFKDISLKRMNTDYPNLWNDRIIHKRKGQKVLYISNKQLRNWTSDMGYVSDIRSIIMDRKAGTRFKNGSKSGSYLFCY